MPEDWSLKYSTHACTKRDKVSWVARGVPVEGGALCRPVHHNPMVNIVNALS